MRSEGWRQDIRDIRAFYRWATKKYIGMAGCDELVAVAQAAGAPLTPSAARAAIEQAATVPPQWRSSMTRDLEDGRRREVDALSGAVVRRGRAHAVPTPIHEAILVCLSLHQPKAA